MKPSIALTGGGTAGHVFPHLALFGERSDLSLFLEAHNISLLYLGSSTGPEKQWISQQAPHMIYHSISTGKLRRYFSLRNFLTPFALFFGFFQALFFLIKYKSLLLFSKGGYVAAPVVWAAWCLRIPIIMHESDLTPALTTKLTAPFAQTLLTCFKETGDDLTKSFPFLYKDLKILNLGLPLRSDLFSPGDQEIFPKAQDKKCLFIFGGSLGAKGLNQWVETHGIELIENFRILHLTGHTSSPSVFQHPHYKACSFLNVREMGQALQEADLAISRAGASALFELLAFKVPMILVPLGLWASRGDQIKNAQNFKDKGWAQILWQEDLEDKGLKTLHTFIDHDLPLIQKNMELLPPWQSQQENLRSFFKDQILRFLPKK